MQGALAALGPKAEIDTDMAEETCNLVKYDESQRNTHATGGQEANDSDEEDEEGMGGGRGQRVQCAQ